MVRFPISHEQNPLWMQLILGWFFISAIAFSYFILLFENVLGAFYFAISIGSLFLLSIISVCFAVYKNKKVFLKQYNPFIDFLLTENAIDSRLPLELESVTFEKIPNQINFENSGIKFKIIKKVCRTSEYGYNRKTMEPNEVSIYKFHLGAELPLRNNFSVHINLLKQKASKHIRLDKNGVVLANRQYLVAITDAKKIGSINESRSQKHIARNGKNHKFFTLLENLNQTNKWTKKEGFGVDNGCIYFQINSFNEIPKIVEQVVLLKQILSSLSASNIIDSLRDKSSSSTHTTSYLKPIFGFKRKKLIQNNFNILDVVEDRTEQQVKRISDNKPYYYDKHHTTDGNYKRLNKYRNKQKQVRKAHAKKHNQPKHLIIEKNGIVYDIYKKKYSRKRIYFDILTRFKLQNSVYFELPHHYFKTLKINSFKQKALVDSDVALTRWIISLGFTIFGDFFSGFLEKLSTDLGNRISMFSSIKVTIGGCSPTLVGDVLDTIDSYTNRVILEQFKVYSDDLFDINEKYEDSICVICFGKIEESNNTRMLECCGSLAHTDHLKPWLLMKNKCPYCNKRMPEVVGMPAVI